MLADHEAVAECAVVATEQAGGAQLVAHVVFEGGASATASDLRERQRDLGFEPKVTIEEGLPRFVAWYRDYHGI